MSDALTIDSGTKTISVTNTAERLAGTQVISGLFIKAATTNAAVVRLRDATVSAASFPLSPGEGISLDVVERANVYVRGTAGDVLYWIATLP